MIASSRATRPHGRTWASVVRIWLLWLLIPGSVAALPAATATRTIDVLIVYTERVSNDYGGADGVEALARSCIVSSNEAFAGSDTNTQLRLVGIKQVDYWEDGQDMGVDIEHLTKPNDGVMDAVHEWRNETGADLVYLFRGDTYGVDSIGIAWILDDTSGSPSAGFGIVTAEYALSDLVLQHEIGHNLGAAHDPDNTEKGGIYPYSYGYRFDARGQTKRTVMAYAPGAQINVFSNPNKEYRGAATGKVNADNARTIRNISSQVVAYRSYKPTHPVAVATNQTRTHFEDSDDDGFHTVSLDGSLSSGWLRPSSWRWSWNGGSASGETAEARLPVGATTVTLTVTNDSGMTDTDTISFSISAYSEVADIVSGPNRLYLLKENGTVLAAGSDLNKQFGLPTSSYPSLDFQKIALDDVVEIVDAYGHTLFRTSQGAVFGIGSNENQQLGVEGQTQVDTFTKILAADAVSIASSWNHILLVTKDGKVWGCGGNSRGQLGFAKSDDPASLQVVFDAGAVKAVAGNGFSALLDKNGGLWISGELSKYISPELDEEEHQRFRKVVDSGVTDLSASYFHLAFTMADGSAWTAGRNGNSGRLGLGQQNDAVPGLHKIVDSGVRSVQAMSSGTYVVLKTGEVLGTGSNLVSLYKGNISTEGKLISLIPGRVERITSDGDFTVALLVDGSVWAGGDNRNGQFGNGSNSHTRQPLEQITASTRDDAFTNLAPTAIAVHESDNVARGRDGIASVTLHGLRSTDDWKVTSYAWSWQGGTSEEPRVLIDLPQGSNAVTLTVSDGEGRSDSQTIDVVVAPHSKAVDVYTFDGRMFVIKEDGSLWAQGYNTYGLFGRSFIQDTEDVLLPLFNQGVAQVSAGVSHCLVLKDDGSVWGAGSNGYGQLGLGAAQFSKGFVPIVSSGAKKIATGDYHSLILMDDGSALGMGRNGSGQLGPTSNLPEGSLIPIHPSQVSDIATSDSKTYLLLETGELLETSYDDERYAYTFSAWDGPFVKRLLSMDQNSFFYESVDGSIGVKANRWEELEFGSYIFGSGGNRVLLSGPSPRSLSASENRLAMVDKDGKCYAYEPPDYSYYASLQPVLAPISHFPSGALKVSQDGSYTLFLLEDGSVWAKTTSSSPYRDPPFDAAPSGIPILLAEAPNPTTNSAPVAQAGPPQTLEDFLGRDGAEAILDGSQSTDDKFIKTWRWSWNDQTEVGKVISARFPLGKTEVTLEVEDTEGLTHTSQTSVTVQRKSALRALDSNDQTLYFLLENGDVYTGGRVDRSNIGFTLANDRTFLRLPLSDIERISGRFGRTMAIDAAGAIWVSGTNQEGELGTGFSSKLTPFTKVIESGAVDFTVGDACLFAVLKDGSLWACGDNQYQNLGHESAERLVAWTKVIESGVAKVRASWQETVILKTDGSVWAWGRANLRPGEEGDVDEQANPPNAPIRILSSGAADIDYFDRRLLITKLDGSLWGLGNNHGAALGLHRDLARSDQLVRLTDAAVRQAKVASSKTLWLEKDGSLWALGQDSNGSLGLGEIGSDAQLTSPQALLRGEVADFTVTPLRTLVLLNNGQLLLSGQELNTGTPYYHYQEAWNPLSPNPTFFGPQSPIADAGQDIVLFRDSYAMAYPFLNGLNSSDDWAIKKWTWEIRGRQYQSAQITPYLREGEYIAKLTVEDHFGNRSTDTMTVTIKPYDSFTSWLAETIENAEIEQMTDPFSNDFDQDGLSNITEYHLGTDPADPSSGAWLSLEHHQGKLRLTPSIEVEGPLPILFSTDLINWSDWNGDIELDPQKSGSRQSFFRLGTYQY
ncbi:M12 family metallo-peptidase [Pelagicoccus sp. SDUM812003]|uniref:M12 family metallo-peptidase n=1 Tax=Pelagicoccus sp. SDUM812003 TaxID=3041267 RepID=UPI00280D4CC3|nr:M12 family metallo-peptidase [Pelagicoccus sp. SDUM812003]MDQ8203402.1 M12 family metallo-peptidase [Pelagicoccus sp. SDUM812003]